MLLPLSPMLNHCNDQFPHSQNWLPSADLGSACKLAPQSLGLPQTKEMFMGVSWLILKLRDVSSLSMGTIYSFQKRSSDQTYVNKHKQTQKRSVTGHLTHHMIGYLIQCHKL